MTRNAQLLVIRHGQTESSAQGLFTGRSNHPLTDRGISQATAWKDVLTEHECLNVWSSNLDRAIQSARAAGYEPLIDGRLAEWDLGELDGRHAESYRSANPGWRLYVDGPPSSSGETPHQVRDRAEDVLSRLYREASDGKLLVAFSHGQFIRVLAAAMLKMPTEIGGSMSLGPGRGMLLVRRSVGRWSLAGWNVAPRPVFEELT